MWDSLLKTLKDESINAAVLKWGGDFDSISLVTMGINAVYRFESQSEIYYLRLTHEKLSPIQRVDAAIAFQKYLFDSGVPICQPVLSIENNLIEKIAQGEQVFLAHACLEVPGQHMNFDFANDQLYRDWGSSLAKLHQTSRKYLPKHHQYGKWENDIAELQGYAKTESQEIQMILSKILNDFQSFAKTQDNYGLIHGDHRKGNVLTDGEQVHFIDFDLPRYCWFMDDISRPFFSSIMLEATNWQTKLKPYIEGYCSVKKILEAYF